MYWKSQPSKASTINKLLTKKTICSDKMINKTGVIYFLNYSLTRSLLSFICDPFVKPSVAISNLMNSSNQQSVEHTAIEHAKMKRPSAPACVLVWI
jgi:hypothetical protein